MRIVTAPVLVLFSLTLAACGGGSSDTDGEGGGVVGDGVRPVVTSAEYACFEDVNGGKYFYFRLEGDDEQGADTIDFLADVLFLDGEEPVDWDGDGQGDADVTVGLTCEAGTDPRRCEGSQLESELSGPCADTTLTFEGWLTDMDGNESDRVRTFEQNPSIAPAG